MDTESQNQSRTVGPPLALSQGMKRMRRSAACFAGAGAILTVLLSICLLPAERQLEGMASKVFLSAWWLAPLTGAVGGLIGALLDRKYGPAPARWMREASLLLPMTALILMLPLSIHAAVAYLSEGAFSMQRFQGYMAISWFLTGASHLILVGFLRKLITEVSQGNRKADFRQGAKYGAKALLWAIAAACIPGALAFGIPPLLVALTGAIPVPLIFGWTAQKVRTQSRFAEPISL